MEWYTTDLQSYPSLETSSFYGMFPSSNGSEWSFEDNKIFEDALVEFDVSSPDFFQNVAARVPWKTADDIKKRYRELVEDLNLIESGQTQEPKFEDDKKQNEDVEGVMGQNINERGKGRTKQCRRDMLWREEEHQLFLMGLNRYGKGDWKNISRHYVLTKTPTQVASHAQKYFDRQSNATLPERRRRPSIHDIQIL